MIFDIMAHIQIINLIKQKFIFFLYKIFPHYIYIQYLFIFIYSYIYSYYSYIFKNSEYLL